jgi:beta-galactosidase
MEKGQDAYIIISCKAKAKTSWCDKGHEVAWEQLKANLETADKTPGVEATACEVAVKDLAGSLKVALAQKGLELTFSKKKGVMSSMKLNGKAVITGGPQFTIWRAPTDNDGVKAKKEQWNADWKPLGRWMIAGYDRLNSSVVSFNWSQSGSGAVTVECVLRYDCRGDKGGFDVTQTYRISPEGIVELGNKYCFAEGMTDVPRLGVRFDVGGEFEKLSWLGMGPHETYPDRKACGIVSRYEGTVSGQYYPYIVPQEHGNKEDVRWMRLANDDDMVLAFQAESLMGANVSRYPVQALQKALHTNELSPSDKIEVHIDGFQRGLGTASCGPDTLEKYKIKPGEYKHTFAFVIGRASEIPERFRY